MTSILSFTNRRTKHLTFLIFSIIIFSDNDWLIEKHKIFNECQFFQFDGFDIKKYLHNWTLNLDACSRHLFGKAKIIEVRKSRNQIFIRAQRFRRVQLSPVIFSFDDWEWLMILLHALSLHEGTNWVRWKRKSDGWVSIRFFTENDEDAENIFGLMCWIWAKQIPSKLNQNFR